MFAAYLLAYSVLKITSSSISPLRDDFRNGDNNDALDKAFNEFRGGTDSALVDSQLLTLITSHMCHSRHVTCIDMINGRTPEWLNLLSMSEDSDHELDALQAICAQINRLIALRIISDDQCDVSRKK